MRTAEKFTVAVVLMAGLLTVAACLKRLIFSIKAGKKVVAGSLDPSYDAAPMVYWSLVDASVGMIAASSMTMRALFRGWSLEKLVASMRIVFSLASLSSLNTRNEHSAHITESNVRIIQR